MIQIINQEQFKTIQFHFQFFQELESDSFAYRFLLTKMLVASTASYPTRKQLNQHLSHLYGLQISDTMTTLANYHLMRFQIVMPDMRYLNDDTLFEKIITLLEEMFFKRTSFDLDVFNDVKRMAIEQISTMKERKYEYASSQFMRHMYQGTELGHPITGTIEELEDISVEALYDYYTRYFLNLPNSLIVHGYLTNQQEKTIQDTFDILVNKQQINLKPIILPQTSIKKHHEYLPMNQAIIFLGYSLPISREDGLYYAAMLVNFLIGSYPESLLFKVFREAYLLAYDVDSDYAYDKRQFYVLVSTDADNYEENLQKLSELIDNYMISGPTEEQLADVKRYIISQSVSAVDYQERIVFKYFIEKLYGVSQTLESFTASIKAVTIDEIKDVLSLLNLRCSYVLHGGYSDES